MQLNEAASYDLAGWPLGISHDRDCTRGSESTFDVVLLVDLTLLLRVIDGVIVRYCEHFPSQFGAVGVRLPDALELVRFGMCRAFMLRSLCGVSEVRNAVCKLTTVSISLEARSSRSGSSP